LDNEAATNADAIESRFFFVSVDESESGEICFFCVSRIFGEV
jgi:hypothetical protein